MAEIAVDVKGNNNRLGSEICVAFPANRMVWGSGETARDRLHCCFGPCPTDVVHYHHHFPGKCFLSTAWVGPETESTMECNFRHKYIMLIWYMENTSPVEASFDSRW